MALSAAQREQNKQDIARAFREAGYTEAQIAGVLGTFEQESGFDPSAVNPSSKMEGIAQWDTKRREAMRTWGSANNVDTSTAYGQAQFAVHELNTTEKKAGTALKNATDVNSAVDAMNSYERFNGWQNPSTSNEVGNRYQYAQAHAGGAPSSNFSTASGSFVPDRKPAQQTTTPFDSGLVPPKESDYFTVSTDQFNTIMAAGPKYAGIKLRDGTLVQVDMSNGSTMIRAPGDLAAARAAGMPSYAELAQTAVISSGYSLMDIANNPKNQQNLMAQAAPLIVEQRVNQIANAFGTAFGVDISAADVKAVQNGTMSAAQLAEKATRVGGKVNAQVWAENAAAYYKDQQAKAAAAGNPFTAEAGMLEARPRGTAAPSAPSRIDQSFVPDRKPTQTPSMQSAALGAIAAGTLGGVPKAMPGRAAMESGTPAQAPQGAAAGAVAMGLLAGPNSAISPDISYTDPYAGLTNQEMAYNGFRGVGTQGYAQPRAADIPSATGTSPARATSGVPQQGQQPVPAGRASVEAGLPAQASPVAQAINPLQGLTTLGIMGGILGAQLGLNGQIASQTSQALSQTLGSLSPQPAQTPSPAGRASVEAGLQQAAASTPKAAPAGTPAGFVMDPATGKLIDVRNKAGYSLNSAGQTVFTGGTSIIDNSGKERPYAGSNVSRDPSSGNYVGNSGANYGSKTSLSKEAAYANNYADYRDKTGSGGGYGGGGGGYGGGDSGGYSSGGGKER